MPKSSKSPAKKLGRMARAMKDPKMKAAFKKSPVKSYAKFVASKLPKSPRKSPKK